MRILMAMICLGSLLLSGGLLALMPLTKNTSAFIELGDEHFAIYRGAAFYLDQRLGHVWQDYDPDLPLAPRSGVGRPSDTYANVLPMLATSVPVSALAGLSALPAVAVLTLAGLRRLVPPRRRRRRLVGSTVFVLGGLCGLLALTSTMASLSYTRDNLWVVLWKSELEIGKSPMLMQQLSDGWRWLVFQRPRLAGRVSWDYSGASQWYLRCSLFYPALLLVLLGIAIRYPFRFDPNRCDHCGYDIRGNPGPRCPECGTGPAGRPAEE